MYFHIIINGLLKSLPKERYAATVFSNMIQTSTVIFQIGKTYEYTPHTVMMIHILINKDILQIKLKMQVPE